ncbi:hypothetical protein GCM10009808_06720 [Microbacterium sediminicola]|uniref:SMP-30/Gluconolactonase/LRE-like region domain-containing protein n=1 Tax=Microbacterium sediminicola TaxID=415210 RepID=A0ABN2HRG2_9MICO
MTDANRTSPQSEPQTTSGVPASVIGVDLRPVVEGLNHPEGICWSPDEECLYAGGEGGELYRFRLDGSSCQTVAEIPGGSFLGLAVDGARSVYVCDVGNRCIQRVTADGAARQYGESIEYPNYPVFDSTGRLWVSDSGEWGTATGGVVRIERDGTTERVLDGLHFANGLAIHDDWLYVVESTWPRVSRVPLSGGTREPVVVLDKVVPDGIAFDLEGGMWIGCWQPNRVYRLAPDGELTIEVDDWSGVYAATPTNVAFAGPRLDVLVLASLATHSITACAPGQRGNPLQLPIGLG